MQQFQVLVVDGVQRGQQFQIFVAQGVERGQQFEVEIAAWTSLCIGDAASDSGGTDDVVRICPTEV